MYMLNGWWFLSSSGSYPPFFMVGTKIVDTINNIVHEIVAVIAGAVREG